MNIDLLREVGRPNWASQDSIPGFDISAKTERILQGEHPSHNFFEVFLYSPEVEAQSELFLRLDLRVFEHPEGAKMLKAFLQCNSGQQKTAVLVCSAQERYEHRGILANIFSSGVRWQERQES